MISENKVLKDIDSAFKRISDYEKYYRMRTEKLKNKNDGLSIGIIENGKKFSKKISIVEFNKIINKTNILPYLAHIKIFIKR